jgi:hypothetical protein
VNVGVEKIAYLDGAFWVVGQTGAMLQSDSADGRPVLTGALATNHSSYTLRIVQNAPSAYRVQVSTNLASQWRDIAAVTNALPPHIWTDTNLEGSALRLYRVVTP